MKRFLFFSLFFIQSICIVFAANGKVVERSERKMPEWVNGVCKGFVITTASGATIEEARNIAIVQVRDQIITSVAIHVVSESRSSSEQIQHNDQFDLQRRFVKQIKSVSGDIPFLNNISLSNVEAYYWEKVKIGKDNYEYHYSVKYPFSEQELNTLIVEFKTREQTLDNQISRFNRQYTTWSDLVEAESQLRTFCAKLPSSDESRINQCRSLLNNYRQYHKELLGDFLQEEYIKMPADGCKVYETPTDTIWVSIITLNSSLYQSPQAMDRVAAVKATRQTAEVMNSGSVIIAETHLTETESSAIFSDEIITKFKGKVNFSSLLKKFEYSSSQYVYIYIL